MSDASTVRMLDRFVDEAPAPMFLASFFSRTTFHRSEFVEIDIERDDEDVAIVVTDITAGARLNESNQYTNKRFKPPVFKEEFALNIWETFRRMPGATPFADPEFNRAATDETFSGIAKMGRKIRRSIEKMVSDILQTGIVTLTDADGNALYTLDFQQKDNHRATAAVTWAADGSTGSPLTDLDLLGDVVRKHGRRNPDTLVFGQEALRRFFASTQVRNQLDNRRIDRGLIQTPSREREGGKYHGTIAIGNRAYEIWLYDGYFRDPATGELTDYIGTENVVMLSSSARLDTAYGACPILEPDQRMLSYIPSDLQSDALGLALTVNPYKSKDNTALMVQLMSRPLPIPVAIDTFGVLDITA